MRFLAPLLLAIPCAGWLAGEGLVFDNTFGGSAVTSAAGVALDPQGNIYVTGTAGTTSTPGNVFVSKWSPDGSQLLYSTNLGGSVGNWGTGIAVDSSGSAYITGFTSSPDFPVTSNAFQRTLAGSQNAFVIKLSADGSQMVYATLLGGAGAAQAFGIAVDGGGNVIITGQTQGTNFPVTPNAVQPAPVSGCSLTTPGVSTTGSAFITKIAPDGASLVYSTLLGGSCATSGQAVALDASGNAWVAGNTDSPDFPLTPGGLQHKAGGGFLAQFTAQGGLAYSSYFNAAEMTGITLDSSGNIYLAGITFSFQLASPGAFQTQPGSYCDADPATNEGPGTAFVAKLAPNNGAIARLTYFGGGCIDSATVAVDASGSPWIAGSLVAGATNSVPTVNPVQIGGLGFLAKFSPDFTQALFSTYFSAINGLALDSSGLAYIAGAENTGQAFVAKIYPTPPPISLNQVLTTGSVVVESNGGIGVAPGEVLRLIGSGIGPTSVTPGIINSSDVVTTSVAGVQVTFGGVPAPLLSVSADEIDCVAPFEIAGQTTTTIQVQFNGVLANPVQMPVVATAVEVLAVLNSDGSLNSVSNPAVAGSMIALYLAGTGQTNPPSQDGQVNQFPLAQAGTPVQVQYSFPVCPPFFCFLPQPQPQTAQITYAGAAPGLIAGILQVNLVTVSEITGGTVQVTGSSSNFSVFLK